MTLLTAKYDDFLHWRESIKQRAPKGISIALSAIRGFYNYAEERGILRQNPFPRSMAVTVKKQEPVHVPTVKEFIEMRAKLEEDHQLDTMHVITRKAIVETLAGTGLRLNALLTLRRQHLHLDESRPYCLVDASSMDCKGAQAGQVPMSQYATGILREYLADKPVNDEPIFNGVTPKMIRSLLKRLKKGLHPHALRHYFCCMTYFKNFDGGKTDLIWVRDAAGHSNVSTTSNYLAMARRIVNEESDWQTWAHGQAQPVAAVA